MQIENSLSLQILSAQQQRSTSNSKQDSGFDPASADNNAAQSHSQTFDFTHMSSLQLHASIGRIAAAGNLSQGEENMLRVYFPLSTLVASGPDIPNPNPEQPQNILKALQRDSNQDTVRGDVQGAAHLQKLIADLTKIQE